MRTRSQGRSSRQAAPCIADIALEFGCEYINMDGTLNRKKMARTVFNDKEKLKKLNNLMFHTSSTVSAEN